MCNAKTVQLLISYRFFFLFEWFFFKRWAIDVALNFSQNAAKLGVQFNLNGKLEFFLVLMQDSGTDFLCRWILDSILLFELNCNK